MAEWSLFAALLFLFRRSNDYCSKMKVKFAWERSFPPAERPIGTYRTKELATTAAVRQKETNNDERREEKTEWRA